MDRNEKVTPLTKRLLDELHIRKQCQRYHLPLWQCPQLLFVAMGLATIVIILVFYFTFSGELDPYSIALISLGMALFLIVQGFIIVHGFERIAEANRMQVEFLNIASHELRSPVTTARWALDFVTSEASKGLSAEAQNCVHIARDAIGEVGKLVTTILRLVRLESGGGMRQEAVPLNALLTNIVDTLRHYASAANLKIVTNVPSEVLFARADTDQVRFVIERLLDNALRYSPQSTAVTVTLTKEDGFAKVTVSDEGEGIPAEDQPYIFNKFFRASNAYLISPQGTGLSLYACRAIVEAFGGRMGFSSVEGKGSTFWFTLPLAAQEPHR
jgi:signal transduction histidine kinase